MESLTFKIEEFEGPLDLLLHLIHKNKMNLYDIAIVELIDQYTAAINNMQSGKIEVASEFIEMAARLVRMKSFMLLPRSTEADRLREELTGQLIEYSACKEVAKKLGVMGRNTFVVVRKPMQVQFDTTYNLRHEPGILLDAWHSLMGRSLRNQAPKQERFEQIVTAPFVSISSRIEYVLRNVLSGKISRLRYLFHRKENRSQTVATFLALLELVRAGRISIDEDEQLTYQKGQPTTQENG